MISLKMSNVILQVMVTTFKLSLETSVFILILEIHIYQPNSISDSLYVSQANLISQIPHINN